MTDDIQSDDPLAALAKEVRAEFVIAKAREDVISDIRLLASTLSARGLDVDLDLDESEGQVVVICVDLGALALPGAQDDIGQDPKAAGLKINSSCSDLLEDLKRFQCGQANPTAGAPPETNNQKQAAPHPAPEDAPDQDSPAIDPRIGEKHRFGFSPREQQEIIDLTAKGCGPTWIANHLGCKPKVVSNFKTHNRGLFQAPKPSRPAKPAPGRAAVSPGAMDEVPNANPTAGRATVSPGPEPAVEAPHPRGLSGPLREIDAYLSSLPPAANWTPARDLALAEGLARGDGAPAVCEALGVSKVELLSRWNTININRGSLTHQEALLKVLRARAQMAGQA